MTLVRNLRQRLSGSRPLGWAAAVVFLAGACSVFTYRPIQTTPEPTTADSVGKAPSDSPAAPRPHSPRRYRAHHFLFMAEGATGKVDRLSMRSIEMFRGAVVAADRLKACGFSVHMHLQPLGRWLRNPEWTDSSVLFGPFWREGRAADSACRSRTCFQVVGGRYWLDSAVRSYPNRLVITPPAHLLGEAAAQRVAQRYPHWKVEVMVDKTDSAERPFFEQWLEGFQRQARRRGLRWQVHHLTPRHVGWRRIPVELKPVTADSHVVIILAVNPEFVTGMLSYLVEKTTEIEEAKLGLDTVLPVVAFGMPQWQRFAHVEPEIWNRLGVEIFTPYYVDYRRPDVQHFVTAYRERFSSEPSPYAFIGFDAAYVMGEVLRHAGYEVAAGLRRVPDRLLTTRNRFDPSHVGGPWINRHVWRLKFVNYRWRPLPESM